MTALKNRTVGGYLQIVAAILGIAGLVLLIINNNISTSYSLSSFGLLTAGAVLGVVLSVVAVITPTTSLGDLDVVSTLSIMVTVGVYGLIIGQMANERILMISGLFSWDSQNSTAWSVFYMMIASIVCFAIAAVLLIITSFMKTVKE
ncbi:MAG: hypothetical protein LUG47_01965 [Clostridiales bacterium]|nr:hypothetical protein [Clostridiales bacterium]